MTNLWNQKQISRADDFERPWYIPAINLLSEIIQPEMRIVELGCGRGELAEIIRRFSKVFYLGFDGNYSNALAAQDKCFLVSMSNFENIVPVKKDAVDIVISLEVIEHIANAEAFLLEIFTILKPGGFLLISTPNVGFIGSRLKFFLRAEIQQEGIHLRFFNKSILSNITTSAGFVPNKQFSIMPLAGYNTIIRLLQLRSKRKYVFVPSFWENWLALHFVWLLKKPEC